MKILLCDDICISEEQLEQMLQMAKDADEANKANRNLTIDEFFDSVCSKPSKDKKK